MAFGQRRDLTLQRHLVRRGFGVHHHQVAGLHQRQGGRLVHRRGQHLHQIARRGDDMLCEANLRVGFITLDGRPRRQPAEWRAAFQTFMNKDD